MRLALLLTLASLTAAQGTVEIDNPWVRVTRLRLAPNQITQPIQRADAVLVFLTDAPQHETGDVVWVGAGARIEENISDKPLEMVVTELKPAPAGPPQPRVALDPVKLDPTHHLVPLENARVRVIRTILEPHLKSPMHEHPHYVVVYLTELHTIMLLGDGKAVDNPRHPGEIAWRDFMKHETENLGEKTAVEIQIELK
jgi:quercetin dioxygenase-like cupin family protein